MATIPAATRPPARTGPAADALLDAVGDAVVVFTIAGLVRYANPAARQWLGAHLDGLARHPEIQPLLRDCALGKASLPQAVRLELDTGGTKPERLAGQLTSGTAGPDFALVFPRGETGESSEEFAQRLVGLFREDLIDPIKGLLRRLTDVDGLPPALARDLLGRGADVAGRLAKLADLIDLFGTVAIELEDRVSLEPLVRGAWDEVSALAAEKRVEASLTGFRDDLPPVYGNARLLSRAVRECLENAVKHSREAVTGEAAAQVGIHAEVHGEHARLTVTNHGLGHLPALGERAYLPFNAARTPITPGRRSPGLGLGLPLARRIVEIHGGFVRVATAHDEAAELVIELPTGAPRREAGRHDIAQAQRYAADLAKLMGRRRAAPDK